MTMLEMLSSAREAPPVAERKNPLTSVSVTIQTREAMRKLELEIAPQVGRAVSHSALALGLVELGKAHKAELIAAVKRALAGEEGNDD